MKKLSLLFLFCFIAFFANGQDFCVFTFKGTLANNTITMCFHPDNNDGKVNGTYYYGAGNQGQLYFTGTAIRQNDGSFRQNLQEVNIDGVVTGYFIGVLKNGIMTGTWTSTDGKRSYAYKLVLQKS